MVDVVARLIRRGEQGGGNSEIPLVDDVTTLGRAPSCQVIIDNDFASRRHAQIIRRDDSYWLRDLDSKNGILLDGQRVTVESLLVDGAEIRIGEALFYFVDPAATRTHPGVAHESALLRVEPESRSVWLRGQPLDPPLSVKQFELLWYLYQRPGEAISKDELAGAVWPEVVGEGIYDYQIDKMVSRVRERIGKEFIETVWGYGYRLKMG